LLKTDLIIADLQLKGKISGMDALNEIQKINNIPIIIISGSHSSKNSSSLEEDFFYFK
jgi:DNA-binding response OmpR family regulator